MAQKYVIKMTNILQLFVDDMRCFKKGENACESNHVQNLTGSYNLDGVKTIQWGRDNEMTATLSFQNITGKKLQPTGLWLDPCGFLGASSDGIVENENSIVEVKCPFKYREEGLIKVENYIVKYCGNNKFVVNKEHAYYDQIQGQLHIMNRDICYLVLWTLTQTEIIQIEKDDAWKNNLNILKTFYCKKYVDYICT